MFYIRKDTLVTQHAVAQLIDVLRCSRNVAGSLPGVLIGIS